MLATRCPACGTVFRVVPDQLRISEGWVRCGRCGEAFNAQQAMVEWPPRRPPEPEALATAPASPAEPAAEPAAAEALTWPADLELVATDGALDFRTSSTLAPSTAEPPEAPPLQVTGEPQATPDAIAEVTGCAAAESKADPEAEPEADPEAAPPHGDSPQASAEASAEAVGALETPAPAGLPPTPSFVVQANRAARWRSPGVRLALALAALLAALGLSAQIGFVWRDRIAAAYPAARPLLQQVCVALACRVGDYRQIDALSVESSGLVRMDGAPVYRLAVTLRNRAALEVAAPALDLSVTDAQGRQIARRVLTMRDLGMPLRTLGPGSEMPIQAPLAIDGAVSGYTVELFYP